VALTVSIEDLREGVKIVRPVGRLDTTTHAILDTALAPVVATFKGALIFNMGRLEFISSAGLSVLFKTRKAMAKSGGRVLFAKLQPQIEKVFQIVRALPDTNVFTSLAEVDEYLATIQAKEIEKGRE
jgi:anti-anti-sigma factor